MAGCALVNLLPRHCKLRLHCLAPRVITKPAIKNLNTKKMIEITIDFLTSLAQNIEGLIKKLREPNTSFKVAYRKGDDPPRVTVSRRHIGEAFRPVVEIFEKPMNSKALTTIHIRVNDHRYHEKVLKALEGPKRDGMEFYLD